MPFKPGSPEPKRAGKTAAQSKFLQDMEQPPAMDMTPSVQEIDSMAKTPTAAQSPMDLTALTDEELQAEIAKRRASQQTPAPANPLRKQPYNPVPQKTLPPNEVLGQY